jgi:hypothetical protein
MGGEFCRRVVVAVVACVLVQPAHADDVRDLTPPGLGDIIPPVRHHTEHPGQLKPVLEGGWYSSAEALLLRPRRGAFDFATATRSASLVADGDIQSLNYELRTGVRGELGYRFGEGGWDVLAGYTYFRTGVQESISAGAGQVLIPTLTRPGLTNQATFAAADANLEYNLFDMTAGKRFSLDEHFAVRAFGGLRFASIRQNFQAYYDGRDARSAAVFAPSNFQGFGPIAGGEAVLTAKYGFHLYGKVSGGLITGPSTNPLLETNNSGATVYANTAYDVRKVVPTVSLGVGGGWQYRTVSFRMGYEITHWFGLIDQPRFTDDASRGKFVSRSADLSLEGLFIQVGLAF